MNRLATLVLIAGTTWAWVDAPLQEETRQPTQPQREQQPDYRRDRQEGGWNWDEYFGKPNNTVQGFEALGSLAGPWKLQVTMFTPEFAVDSDATSSQSDNQPEPRDNDRSVRPTQTREDQDDDENRPVSTTTGYSERRWALNGNVLVERYTCSGTAQDLPLSHEVMGYRGGIGNQPTPATDATKKTGRNRSGLVLWGYDPAEKQFTVAWSGSETSAVHFGKSELSENDQGKKQITIEGSYHDPYTDEEYSTRTVITFDSPDQQTLTMYRDPGIFSAEKKVMQIVYTRDKAFAGFGSPVSEVPTP